MPGCVTCHSNHEVQRATDALLGVSEGAACAACHSADDAAGRTATEMRTLIDTLRSEHESARNLLMRAEPSVSRSARLSSTSTVPSTHW